MDTILEFFYEKASQRIKEKIKEKNICYSDIYAKDPKQICWIVNNKRTKNNRFLICDAVLKSSESDTETECGLIPVLGFSKPQEILWGTEQEIELYLPELFKLLWKEVINDNSEYADAKELLLCDYVPYAKYSAYWDILFNDNKYPAIMYGISEDAVVDNIDSSRDIAFEYLYYRCENEFKRIFLEFSSLTKSFHKINKVFQEEFIDSRFLPMLEKRTQNKSSLGFRVKSLIYDDLKMIPLLIQQYHSKEINMEISKQWLINASSKYILELEEIQNEIWKYSTNNKNQINI